MWEGGEGLVEKSGSRRWWEVLVANIGNIIIVIIIGIVRTDSKMLMALCKLNHIVWWL